MSSHGELRDHCKFGHVFMIMNEDKDVRKSYEVAGTDVVSAIQKGDIEDLEDVKNLTGDYFLRPIMGDHYKSVKVRADSQGTPYVFILKSADDLDEKLDYNVNKTMEKIHISPQNTMHDEFMQRKRQAEQRVNQTLGSLSDLRKQKHMLEHDIRKLRSRAEAISEGDETQLKADFVELVDGAGAGGQQGGDEAALKFFRDNNIYPSIVADFNEMDSVEDLEGDGKLADLPENIKAILKKKYTMYEKWKDLYGSEVQRKLNELKSQLRNIERSIEETKEWLEPYVKDITMINQKTQDDLGDDISKYMTFVGYASQFKELEFINYKPLKMHEGQLNETENEDEATHFKILYMHCAHVNIAGGENPNSPAQGPTAGKVFWFPAIVCRHVFENIFKQKIEKSKKEFEQVMADYTGEFESEGGEELKEAREEKGIPIRKLREKVEEEIGERVPVKFSAALRRVEDGFEPVDHIEHQYSEKHLEAIDEILDTSFSSDAEEESKYPLTGFDRKIQAFTGQFDPYYIPDDISPISDFKTEFKFSYYYDLKIQMGLYTMK